MRVLVTGARGFVGRHLVAHLLRRKYEVVGVGLKGDMPADGTGRESDWIVCDIRDKEELLEVVRSSRPDCICHLAAYSSPRNSFSDFPGVLNTNFWGTFNLLEAARYTAPQARVVVVGSAQCYGAAKTRQLPLLESHILGPKSPYSLSKAAADLLAYYYYSHFHLDVVRARPFNHTGPGQDSEFVSSGFARQIVEIEMGLRPPEVLVGNLKVKRDFTDVRDVVRAYELLLRKGRAGEAYNVASGKAVSIRRVLEILLAYTPVPIRVRVDGKRFRAEDTAVLYGSYSKLRRHTGWVPQIKLTTTLRQLIDYWRKTLQG